MLADFDDRVAIPAYAPAGGSVAVSTFEGESGSVVVLDVAGLDSEGCMEMTPERAMQLAAELVRSVSTLDEEEER